MTRPTSDTLQFVTGGVERVRITDAGRVGIGIIPTQPLTVAGADSIGIDDYVLHNGDGNTKFGFNGADSFKVRTGGGDRFVIGNDNSYFNTNLGVGISSPAAKISATGTIRAEGMSTITGGGKGTEVRYDTSGDWGGILSYDRGNSAYKELRVEGSIIKFKESGADVMTIDNGNVLVGKTSADNTTAGIRLDSGNKFMSIVRAGNPSLILNRTASDGDILQFRKDGTTIGTIGTDSNSQLVLGSGDTGLSFQSNNNAIIPRNTDGTARDNGISLGNTGARFKELYLSGQLKTNNSIDLNTGSGSTNAILFFNNSVKNGWIGIPAWDNQSLRAYAPSPVSGNTNEPAFKYGSGAWSFWTDYNNTSGNGSTSTALFISTGGSVNVGRGDLQMNGTTVITSARVLEQVILDNGTAGARRQVNAWHYDAGNNRRFYFDDAGAGNTYYGLNKTSAAHIFRNGSDQGKFTISETGGINIADGDNKVTGTTAIAYNGTAVLDTSRNLVNIGTISSGAISSSGNLTITQSSGNNTLYLNSSGGGNPVIYMEDSTRKWGQFVASGTFYLKNETANIETLKLENNGNITFVGNMNIGGTGNNNVRVRHIEGKEASNANLGGLFLNYSSTANVQIGHSGNLNDLYIYGSLRTGGTARIDNSGNLNNINNVTQVNGDYIYNGGGNFDIKHLYSLAKYNILHDTFRWFCN